MLIKKYADFSALSGENYASFLIPSAVANPAGG